MSCLVSLQSDYGMIHRRTVRKARKYPCHASLRGRNHFHPASWSKARDCDSDSRGFRNHGFSLPLTPALGSGSADSGGIAVFHSRALLFPERNGGAHGKNRRRNSTLILSLSWCCLLSRQGSWGSSCQDQLVSSPGEMLWLFF